MVIVQFRKFTLKNIELHFFHNNFLVYPYKAVKTDLKKKITQINSVTEINWLLWSEQGKGTVRYSSQKDCLANKPLAEAELQFRR